MVIYKEPQTDLQKNRESNSCEENSGLTHHGNYTYAVICQLWIHMEKIQNSHTFLLQIERVGVSMVNAIVH